jgi:DNA repair protein RecO (recombination protein O)
MQAMPTSSARSTTGSPADAPRRTAFGFLTSVLLMAIRHDSGIVLRTYPLGEADRIVVLLSPHRGKVRAVAKGIRKTKSRFGGRLEPFTHVEMVLYEGRNLDTVTQVEVSEAFPRLRGDLDRVAAASTMLEAADAVAQEDQASVALFDLLASGLRALDSRPASPDLVTAFLLQLAGVLGLAPALDSCASCGRLDGLERFSFAAGGSVCGTCRPEGSVRLRPGVTAHLARLATSEFADVGVDADERSGEAMGIARRFVEYHLDRRLVSLAAIGS